MRIVGLRAVLVIALTVTGSQVFGQQPESPPPGCSAWNADLPREWAGWSEPATTVNAASNPSTESGARVELGKKASITLAPAKTVHMVVETPDTEQPQDAHKGLLSFRVPADGTYWVGLSEGLWVDVVAAGKILDSVDHGPGPKCASVRKSVAFALKAGEVTIQLSDNKGPHVDLIVVRTR